MCYITSNLGMPFAFLEEKDGGNPSDTIFRGRPMGPMVAGLFAVLCLFAVITAKYLTSAKLQSWRQRVIESENEARKARGRMKAAENEKGVASRGVNTQERKKKTLERHIDKFRKELAELKS